MSGGRKVPDFNEITTHPGISENRPLGMAQPADLIDRGGRRLGIERRQFDYSLYIPERRAGSDRRVLIDGGGRRLGIERRQFVYSHYIPERRAGLG